jgi:hypothetical protein
MNTTQNKSAEPDQHSAELAARAAHLDGEEMQALTFLLRALREDGIQLSEAIAHGCVAGAKMTMQWAARELKEQECLQEEYRQRDARSGQSKVTFMVGIVTAKLMPYTAKVQKTIVKRLLGQTVTAEEVGGFAEQLPEAVKDLSLHFANTPEDFQTEVLRHYFDRVLPHLEAKEAKGDAKQDAVDLLLNDVVAGKSAEEILAVVEQLKAS